jgi:transcriptional regulator GlxA family with amidase domain
VQRRNVGIFVFDGVEVLDFAGPFEVFSRTRLSPGLDSRRSDETAPFEVFTVAAVPGIVTATGGLRIEPRHTFETSPRIDLLVVPGGFGTRALVNDPDTLDWIRRVAEHSERLTSVCTGALLLAAAGLLRDRPATTHWGALDLLGQIDPSIQVERSVRMVHDGAVTTSAGVSAGIDMAIDVVRRMFGNDVAADVVRYMEYAP